MARQLLGPRKVRKLREQTGLDIDYVLVRGNTGRRGGGTTYGAVEILAELGLWSGLGYADVGIFAENSRKTELLWTRVWEALVEKQIYGPPARATRAPRYIEMPWGARVMAFSLGEDGLFLSRDGMISAPDGLPFRPPIHVGAGVGIPVHEI